VIGNEAYLLIYIKKLVKRFQHKNIANKIEWKTAVDGLDLHILPGEIFGLLGPNGAGKTTTIRMLTMLTQPTAGEIFYDGINIRENARAMKQLIGVVPQHINFDQDLTVGENMELHARLHHMQKVDRRQRIAELLEYVELNDRINDSVRSLSGGMKRRLLIARALIHRPKILFLDEPTVALDPQVRRRIWDLIRRMHNEHVTVLLTTHYIEEAENLCARVAILNKGKRIALDTPQALCEKLGRYVVEWDEQEKREYRFFASRELAAGFAATIEDAATIRHSNLEDVFVELTGRKVNS
jgi:ABC-2 type transport system ATP-binding protein